MWRLIFIGVVVLNGGCFAFSVTGYEGAHSDHFDGKRFYNRGRVIPPSFWSLIKWGVSRRQGPWKGAPNASPGDRPPERVTGQDLRITFVNHATTLVQLDGVNILTDPIYSERASPVSWAGPKRVRPPGIRFADLPKIDIVVVSHNHYDHMDIDTLRRLEQRDHPRIFVGLGNSRFLKENGITGAEDLDWGQARAIKNGLTVHGVPSRHWSGRGLFDRGSTLWLAFVISSKRAGSIYFAGDTGYGPHFKRAYADFGAMRLAILPIGAFRPRWIMKTMHMNPHEAILAHHDLHAETSIAIHFGTFALADDGEREPVDELYEELKLYKQRPRPQFFALQFGEGRNIPYLSASSDSTTKAFTVGEFKKATFAGGCFWCMEAAFEGRKGVLSVVSGYAGGRLKFPSYRQVSSGRTGHAEVIQVTYDAKKTSYDALLRIFWRNIDPVAKNRQFCDVGRQYRSAIFVHGREQERLARKSKRRLIESGRFSMPIETDIVPLRAFYRAEEYHQDYFRKNREQYERYRKGCGRDRRLRQLWGQSDAHK